MEKLIFCSLLCVCAVFAANNGKAITPPMGWRSWNLYGSNVDQKLIQSQMDGITSRKRMVDGVPTSLADLGYIDVGLDDNWQACGSYGPDGYTYHDENGNPVVNLNRFPDMKAMTDYAHKLNLTAGWYGNNCICKDHCTDTKCYAGDVKATLAYGFDSIKLDGCGLELNLTMFMDMFNKSGKSILVENCHWGGTLPTYDWCPFNYYRSSGDISGSYESVTGNLQTTIPLAKQNLSTPGCWAYPDMLEVGCPGLSVVESQSHFGAWCIVSSPLILSHDLLNDTVSDAIWDIITNREAIAVNQAWAGESGTVCDSGWWWAGAEAAANSSLCKKNSNSRLAALHCVPTWQLFYKPLSRATNETAVLLMNHHFSSLSSLKVSFAKVPSLAKAGVRRVHVRDIWNHKDLGVFTDSYVVNKLASHDSVFLKLTPA